MNAEMSNSRKEELATHSLNLDRISNIILNHTAADLQKMYNFDLCSFGGCIVGGIQDITLRGVVCKLYTREEARRIVVESALLFRNNANAIYTSRPLLCSYPLPIKCLTISFFIQDQAADQPFAIGEMRTFGISRGVISYDTCNEHGALVSLKKELFEEALRIVEQERKEQGLPSLVIPCSQLQEIPIALDKMKPETGSKIPEEKKLDKLLIAEYTKLATAHDLLFLRLGSFAFPQGCVYYSASFCGFKPLTLAESRNEAKSFCQQYVSFVQMAPEIQKFQQWRQKRHVNFSPPDIPPVSELAFKITFWDKDMNPQLPPNIAQITLLNEKISYYQADSVTHELTLVYQESYEAPQNKEAT